MIERHIAVFGRECRHRAPPEPRGCEHIRLVHGRDLATAQTCRLERKACDTFYLGHGVVLHVPCALRAVHLFRLAFLAEVDAADQLAHDDEIDTAHERGFER